MIGIGASVAAILAGGQSSIQISATTAPDGSLYYLAVTQLVNAPAVTISDNLGNTWSTRATVAGTNYSMSVFFARFPNKGVNGGPGYVLTIDQGAGNTQAMTAFFLEITGSKMTAGSSFDGTGMSSAASGPPPLVVGPYSANPFNVTYGEMLVSAFASLTSAVGVFTESDGSTILLQEGSTGGQTPGAMSTSVFTSAGSHSVAWSDGQPSRTYHRSSRSRRRRRTRPTL